jgi:hypothetical protein
MHLKELMIVFVKYIIILTGVVALGSIRKLTIFNLPLSHKLRLCFSVVPQTNIKNQSQRTPTCAFTPNN